MRGEEAGAIIAGLFALFIFVVVLGAWVSLIVFGIKAAKKKNRSPHWMWFGIHPFGALIVFIVMQVLPPLKECPNCRERVKGHAKVCAYCQHPFETPGPPAPA